MKYRKSSGLTLMECLTAISILSVLCTLALPQLTKLLVHQQSIALRDAIASSLAKARAHSITQRTSTEMCPGTEYSLCSNGWSKGWHIRDAQVPANIIGTYTSYNNVELHWNGFGTRPRFLSDGSSPNSNGRFYACSKQKLLWQIILNRQGRTRLATADENSISKSLCQ